DQSLGLMSDARQRDLAPERWDLGDRFVLTQGFAVAFLGWQFDMRPSQGLTFEAPVAPVRGVVRASYVEDGSGARFTAFGVQYCARDRAQPDATLTFRTAIDGPAEIVPRDAWQFASGGCAVIVPAGFKPGLYEAVYEAEGSPVAGLGLAAIRDFASYLKFGAGGVETLRERPSLLRRVVGFGYSQSGRLLREFVRDGFNQDERGRASFDGLMIASAGAGGGRGDHQPVERRPAALVLVEAVAHELAQQASALRVAEAHHAAQERRAFPQRLHATGAELQVRREVADGREPEARHRRAFRLVHGFVEPRLEAGRHDDRAAAGRELPRVARHDLGGAVDGGAERERGVGLRAVAGAVLNSECSEARAAAVLDVACAHDASDRRDRGLEGEPLRRPHVELPPEKRHGEALGQHEAIAQVPALGREI